MSARHQIRTDEAARRQPLADEDDLGVGAQIRAIRSQRHLTLAALAQQVGITRSALSQIERNQANPTLGTLKNIASALGMTIGEFFPAPSVPVRVVVRAAERQ